MLNPVIQCTLMRLGLASVHLHALRVGGRRPEQSLAHLPMDLAKSSSDCAMSSKS